MPNRSLTDFLESLHEAGELVRVAATVDPELEIAAITRRVAGSGGPALLFDRLSGERLPVVTNLLGSVARICRVLGVDTLEQVAERTEALLRQMAPQGWLDRLRMSTEQSALDKFLPKTVKTGPCQQIVRLGRDIDLARLPALRSWPAESQPSLDALVVTRDARQRERCVSPCRLQIVDRSQLALVDDGRGHWLRHWREAQRSGDKLPLVVLLGGDPAWRVAAEIPLAAEVDGYHFAGLLRAAPLELVKARSMALELPAETDVVLEGCLDPSQPATTISVAARQGGHYRLPLEAPLLQVATMTQRTSALVPAEVQLTSAATALSKTVERILLPLVRAAIPELVDYALPGWGGSDRFAFLAIRKSYPLEARKAASALWGLTAMQSLKFVVLVDEQVDVHDAAQVWQCVGSNVDPGRDLFLRDGPSAVDDHACPVPLVGRQVGIDATEKLAGERDGAWPAPLVASPEVLALVERRWSEYGLPS